MASKLKKSLDKTRIGGAVIDRADVVKGMCTYFIKPDRRGNIQDAFNAQHGRQKIFKAITGEIDFHIILETGTFLGLTTEYMNKTSGLRVMTTESNPKYYGFARQRFHNNQAISVAHSDSRAFLESAISGLDSKSEPVFLYLDAHWYADLPLLDEVEIVFTKYPKSVVLIDDFQVPDDAGYGYDDYGNGNTLHMPYFDPVAGLGFTAFFPMLPSEVESGAKRGCVVLATDPELIEKLRSLDVLREYVRETAGSSPG